MKNPPITVSKGTPSHSSSDGSTTPIRNGLPGAHRRRSKVNPPVISRSPTPQRSTTSSPSDEANIDACIEWQAFQLSKGSTGSEPGVHPVPTSLSCSITVDDNDHMQRQVLLQNSTTSSARCKTVLADTDPAKIRRTITWSPPRVAFSESTKLVSTSHDARSRSSSVQSVHSDSVDIQVLPKKHKPITWSPAPAESDVSIDEEDPESPPKFYQNARGKVVSPPRLATFWGHAEEVHRSGFPDSSGTVDMGTEIEKKVSQPVSLPETKAIVTSVPSITINIKSSTNIPSLVDSQGHSTSFNNKCNCSVVGASTSDFVQVFGKASPKVEPIVREEVNRTIPPVTTVPQLPEPVINLDITLESVSDDDEVKIEARHSQFKNDLVDVSSEELVSHVSHVDTSSVRTDVTQDDDSDACSLQTLDDCDSDVEEKNGEDHFDMDELKLVDEAEDHEVFPSEPVQVKKEVVDNNNTYRDAMAVGVTKKEEAVDTRPVVVKVKEEVIEEGVHVQAENWTYSECRPTIVVCPTNVPVDSVMSSGGLVTNSASAQAHPNKTIEKLQYEAASTPVVDRQIAERTLRPRSSSPPTRFPPEVVVAQPVPREETSGTVASSSIESMQHGDAEKRICDRLRELRALIPNIRQEFASKNCVEVQPESFFITKEHLFLLLLEKYDLESELNLVRLRQNCERRQAFQEEQRRKTAEKADTGRGGFLVSTRTVPAEKRRHPGATGGNTEPLPKRKPLLCQPPTDAETPRVNTTGGQSNPVNANLVPLGQRVTREAEKVREHSGGREADSERNRREQVQHKRQPIDYDLPEEEETEQRVHIQERVKTTKTRGQKQNNRGGSNYVNPKFYGIKGRGGGQQKSHGQQHGHGGQGQQKGHGQQHGHGGQGQQKGHGQQHGHGGQGQQKGHGQQHGHGGQGQQKGHGQKQQAQRGYRGGQRGKGRH